jgi:hypothetical protein
MLEDDQGWFSAAGELKIKRHTEITEVYEAHRKFFVGNCVLTTA